MLDRRKWEKIDKLLEFLASSFKETYWNVTHPTFSNCVETQFRIFNKNKKVLLNVPLSLPPSLYIIQDKVLRQHIVDKNNRKMLIMLNVARTLQIIFVPFSSISWQKKTTRYYDGCMCVTIFYLDNFLS